MSTGTAPLAEFFNITVLDTYKLLYTHWRRAVTSAEYRAGQLAAYELIRDHHLVAWVMDSTRNNPAMPDQKWSVEYMGQLLQGTLLRNVAMVRANDVFIQVVAEVLRDKIYERYGQEKHLEHFGTLEEALQFALPGVALQNVLAALQDAGNEAPPSA